MKKRNLKSILAVFAAAVTSLSLLAGCGNGESLPTSSDSSQGANHGGAGVILLSVNPEIEVEYDQSGLVLEVEAANDDGKSLLDEAAGSYQGEACGDVVAQLVEKMYETGIFDETVGGHTKNIVIKLEEGSAYPNQDFLKAIGNEVRKMVEKCGGSSQPMLVEEDDYTEDGKIGLEKAKELVLAQLGLTEATFLEKEYELDDGIYELEFTANNTEYEFEVDAFSGKVLEADYERNDDWDDDLDDSDDRYDDSDDDDRYDDSDDDDRYDDSDDDDRYDDSDDDWDD